MTDIEQTITTALLAHFDNCHKPHKGDPGWMACEAQAVTTALQPQLRVITAAQAFMRTPGRPHINRTETGRELTAAIAAAAATTEPKD